MHRFKLHLISATYCLVLVSLNWTTTKEVRQDQSSSTFTAPIAVIGTLLSLVVCAVLARQCLKLAGKNIESRQGVLPGRWIQSWTVLIYVVPLFFRVGTTSSFLNDAGAITTISKTFGHAFSIYTATSAAVGLLLFQIHLRLSASVIGNEESRAQVAFAPQRAS